MQDSDNLWRHKFWSNKFIASKNGAILWHHNMVPFNDAILWHVCTRLYINLTNSVQFKQFTVQISISFPYVLFQQRKICQNFINHRHESAV